MKEKITYTELHRIMEYSKEHGYFLSKVNSRKVLKGSMLGSVNSYGVPVISIKGKLYTAARLAFFYVYGYWPDFRLKCINGSTSWMNIQACNA